MFSPLRVVTDSCSTVLPDSIGTLKGTQLTKIALGIASAFSSMAKLRVVLKNLHPKHIFLTHDGLPKIGCYDEAHALDHTPSEVKREPSVYDSPEILSNRAYTEKSDVYSFGMLLFWMATRETPYAKQPIEKVTKRVAAGKRPGIPGKVPSALRKLIQQCWAGEPNERPSWKAIIERFLSHTCAFPGTAAKEITLFSQTIINAENIALRPLETLDVVKNSEPGRDAATETGTNYSYSLHTARSGSRRRRDDSYETYYSDDYKGDYSETATPRRRRRESGYDYYSSDSPPPRKRRGPSVEPPEALDLRIIADIAHPEFDLELRRADEGLRPSQYARFFEILSGYMQVRIDDTTVLRILRVLKRILTCEPIVNALLQSGMHRYLPIDDPQLSDASIDVIWCLFKFRADFFDGNYETAMIAVISTSPEKAISLFRLYATQFALIENPWPIVDRFLRSYRIYFRLPCAVDYIRVITFLTWKHTAALAPRLRYIREIIERFLDRDDSATVAECYRGLCQLPAADGELPLEALSRHLCDEAVRADALELLERERTLPCSPGLLRGLLRAAASNADAARMVVGAAGDEAVAGILLRNPKWMLYPLPTFTWTVRLCLALCEAPRTATRFDAIREVEGLIAAIVESAEQRALEDLPRFLLKIEYRRLTRLDKAGFFRLLRGKIESAEDPLPYVALLTTLARLGEAPSFGRFARVLRALLEEDGAHRHAAIRALSILSAYPACVSRFRDARLVDAVADLPPDRATEKYVATFMQNMRDIE
jgi:hypothetical protein